MTRPRVQLRKGVWLVRRGEHTAGAWRTRDKALRHAEEIAIAPMRTRALLELARAAESLARMERRRA